MEVNGWPHTPDTSPSGKQPNYSLNKRPGGPSKGWTFLKQQIKILPLAGLKP